MTRNQIETALDNGQLTIRMGAGNTWKVRRNGKTQTWITRPNEFRIPIKLGLRGHAAITQDSIIENFIIEYA